jgi:hypothetical protein
MEDHEEGFFSSSEASRPGGVDVPRPAITIKQSACLAVFCAVCERNEGILAGSALRGNQASKVGDVACAGLSRRFPVGDLRPGVA